MSHPEEIDNRLAGTPLAPLINPDAAPQRSGVLSELNMVAGALQLLPKREDTKAIWSAAAWARERQGWLFISTHSGNQPNPPAAYEHVAGHAYPSPVFS